MRQMMGSLKALLCIGLLSVERADAHGAVTIPKPRNAIDGDQAPWSGKVPWPIPFGAHRLLSSAAATMQRPPNRPNPLWIATATQRPRCSLLCGRPAELVRAPVSGHGGQGRAQSHGIERSGV